MIAEKAFGGMCVVAFISGFFDAYDFLFGWHEGDESLKTMCDTFILHSSFGNSHSRHKA